MTRSRGTWAGAARRPSSLACLGLLGWLGVAAALPAQGPLKRERWADLHLELLRERVRIESQGRDDDTLQRVADLLVADDRGVPFLPAARALAVLRDVEADPEFEFRCTVGAYVLPEVVDPEARIEDCHRLNVTVLLPYSLPVPGELGFEVEVFDEGGERLFRGTNEGEAPLDDVRMAYVSIVVPAGEFEDGAYRMRLSTRFGGEGPRPQDYAIEHRFHVLRGYQERADAVRAAIAVAAPQLEPVPRALLQGLGLEVDRAYNGEPFDGTSAAVLDLQHAERAVENAKADRPVLEGLPGPVPTALPTGGPEVLGAVLQAPKEVGIPRPLVVAIGMAPAYDVSGRRPAAPTNRSARWLQRRIGDLGLGKDQPIAWLQSPGGGVPFARALPTALESLHELLPTDGRTVFVLELDAAMALVFAPEVLGSAGAAVLVGAGTLQGPLVERLGDIKLLGVELTGHPSSRGLRYTEQLFAREGADRAASFRLAPTRPRPWVFGAWAARAEIAAFVRAFTTDR